MFVPDQDYAIEFHQADRKFFGIILKGQMANFGQDFSQAAQFFGQAAHEVMPYGHGTAMLMATLLKIHANEDAENYEAALEGVDVADKMMNLTGWGDCAAYLNIIRGRIHQFKGDPVAAKDAYEKAADAFFDLGDLDQASIVRSVIADTK